MTTLWDTTGSDVVKALAAERRSAGVLAFGLALTLVVVVDEQNVTAAEAAATAAAAAHPCRLLIVVRRQMELQTPRLDAEVSIGGRLGPGEAVVMRMYGRLGLHAESVVLPLLASDAPVVTWWHGEAPERIAYDPLGVFADRRVTDSLACADPVASLHQRAADYAPGDVDLAWTRATPWRALLAGAFDQVAEPPRRAVVRSHKSDPTAYLIGGWLNSRLGIPVEQDESGRGKSLTSVRVIIGDGPDAPASSDGDGDDPSGATGVGAANEVSLTRHDSRAAKLSRPGQPDRTMPLSERGLGDLLAEELRRLDADATYSDALSAWSGLPHLSSRSGVREHVWRDPMQQNAAESATTESPAGTAH